MSELEHRAAEVVDVSFPKRQIELIVMPYEKPAEVYHQGRYITEVCSRGAYGTGISGRKDVRVNRDHDSRQTCGRAVKFHPTRDEGLVAELQISRTPLGDETLELAGDGVLDASAGFALQVDKRTGRVRPDAEVWEENRSRRRLNHLWLGHVALTPEPAYRDANVLAVRNAETVALAALTPNLDRYRLAELEAMYADMDRRYAVPQR